MIPSDYLFVMRYKICSSFPLYDVINFHKEKEYEMKEFILKEGKETAQNLALVTVVASRIENENSNKNRTYIAIDEENREMVHYAENASGKVSNLANSGIYLFSVRIFAEYGLSPFADEQP